MKFFKLSNGLIECRIFQLYESGWERKQKIVYRKPITTLLESWMKSFDTFIVNNGYNGLMNINVHISTTDDNGNINGEHRFSSYRQQIFSVDISFANPRKQQEMDNLYRKIKQQEEYYNLHKDEIDTFRALAAAYDKKQARQDNK